VAAAVVVVAVGLPVVVVERREHASAAYVRTGDIRDAFYVARELEQRHGAREVSMTFDENHDGKVDREDVGLLAMAAVRLEKEGGR
jgi:hypothetical protein